MTRRILVTGSRTWFDLGTVHGALVGVTARWPDEPLVLIHGDATGADRIAGRMAMNMGMEVEAYPANWRYNGRAAGVLRNTYMVSLGADICLAFIRGGSVGASDCARKAEAAGIETVRFEQP